MRNYFTRCRNCGEVITFHRFNGNYVPFNLNSFSEEDRERLRIGLEVDYSKNQTVHKCKQFAKCGFLKHQKGVGYVA